MRRIISTLNRTTDIQAYRRVRGIRHPLNIESASSKREYRICSSSRCLVLSKIWTYIPNIDRFEVMLALYIKCPIALIIVDYCVGTLIQLLFWIQLVGEDQNLITRYILMGNPSPIFPLIVDKNSSFSSLSYNSTLASTLRRWIMSR
jgi:hypothetical protein